MVKINKIYTKTGDDGTTSLVGGSRISKDSAQVDAYGDVDELNSYIGLARTLADRDGQKRISDILEDMQQRLFDVGAILASPSGATHESLPQIPESKILEIEKLIDEVSLGLPELRSFVLPGGSELNAHLHIARAICRRVERKVISLAKTQKFSPNIVPYLNRLSDLLFAMARNAAATSKAAEYLWKPGGR